MHDTTVPRRQVGITPLKARRLARGMTIRELAQVTGIPKDTIAGYEVGLKSPPPDRKRVLAEAFGIAVRDLCRPIDVALALDRDVVKRIAREVARELRSSRRAE